MYVYTMTENNDTDNDSNDNTIATNSDSSYGMTLRRMRYG